MNTEEIITQDDNPHALVVRASDERSAILLMDRTDLDQAMAELRGEVVEQFVYVPKGGKKTLSYAGIKEAARLYRNVHFGATATPLADGSWMITSYAHNLADNVRVDYPMPYPAFDPRDRDASIDFRANLSKSLRNALAAVLPVAYLNTMIARWMEVKSGAPPAARPVSRSATAHTPVAERAQTTTPAPPAAPPAARTEAHDEVAARTAPQTQTPHAPAATGATVTAPVPQPAGDPNEVLRADLATPDPHATLRAEVVALLADDGPALALLMQQRKPLPPEQDAATLAKTRAWLLQRKEQARPKSVRLAEQIARAGTDDAIKLVLADARQAQEKKEITAAEYKALYDAGQARKAEMSSPLLAGGPAAIAS